MKKPSTILRLLLVIPVSGGHQYISFGICYISSYLKKYGNKKIQIYLADENAGDNVLDKVSEIKPNIVAFTATSPQISRAGMLAHEIKKTNNDIYVIVGGVHPTILPKQTLINYPSIDLAVIGEGEETMKELCDLWIKNQGNFFKGLSSVRGIVYRSRARMTMTKKREPISDLDKIPFPDREILNQEYYLSPRQLIRGFPAKRSTSILTSRGCPYHCKFCSSNVTVGRYKACSAGYVIKEVKELVQKYKIDGLLFHDDLFLANCDRVNKICDGFIKSGLNKKIIWACEARANLVNERTVPLLKKMKLAGCRQIEFGFESGNNRVLQFLKGASVSVAQNQLALDISKMVGLRVFGNFMIGSPTETQEEIEETKKFIIQNIDKIDFFQVFLTVPFPGTKIWDICLAKKLIKKKEKFDDFFFVNGDNEFRAFSDLVSYDYLKKTVDELNRLAIKKISLQEKFIWLFNVGIKNPELIKRRVIHYLFG